MRANEQNTQVLRSTQTFVGLRCWFAAKNTRSPLRRRFARSPSRPMVRDRKSTRLNSSHTVISYAVFCLKKKKKNKHTDTHNKTKQASDKDKKCSNTHRRR